jgi:hypothetical protein
MAGSIFRLNGISRDAHQEWNIQMTLCASDEHDLQDVLTHMKKQNGIGPTNLQTFGKILWQMGKLDLAKEYYCRLLTDLSWNAPLRSNIYKNLAQIAAQKGDLDGNIEWQRKLLEFKRQHQPTSPAHNGSISYSIGKRKSIANFIVCKYFNNLLKNKKTRRKIVDDLFI